MRPPGGADAGPGGRKVIDGYGDGGFRIAGARFEGSVIVFAERVLAWPAAAWKEIDAASLQSVVAAAARIDILLLGCGRDTRPLDAGLRARLRAHGIAVDAMSTGAACRTFNVLLAENRAVAAALIAV